MSRKIISKSIKIVVKGKEYTSISALARDNHLPVYVVSQRIRDYGKTPEEAVYPNGIEMVLINSIKGKGKEVVVNGKKYKSITALARDYDTTPENILVFLIRGSTLEQAVGLEQSNMEREIKFHRDQIPLEMIQKRTLTGLTLKQAIELGRETEPNDEGRYNLKILNIDPKLSSKQALLYFVVIEINGKQKYKIGVTTRTAKQRLMGFGEFTYNGEYFVEIKVFKSTLIECVKLEQKLFKTYFKYSDTEIKYQVLDGYTEVLDLPQEKVKAIINEIEKNKH